nr:CsgG/HfaB family protein [Spirochaetales bacterium]
MVRKLLCLVAFVCVCVSAYAGPPRMAIGDFTVTSDNPKLKYVGKGFAEMIGAELALSKGVVLIDRAKRDQLLGELEFSLSGLSDSDSMLRAGELLAADYLLFGDLVDLGDAVLVSCKMVKTETGEVAWQDKYLGPLADYD